ncbi:S8 family serine peptidase [Proteiniphilum sp. X52]|uniref:S8 family peptidase n=1 Tax=Proteiniphilum sp. X52 TaxID=2382159 RepID=UPI000F0A6DBA|nr:S8 family serine peptidase [Proteiniphilum sp. X52]RNC65401.1 protease [Proteiniphilum sp. X52]
MQPPKLGRQTFLKDNIVSATSANPRYTGRYFLILDKNNQEILEAIRMLEKKWGLSVASTADFIITSPDESQLKDADALVFNELGVALVGVEEEKVAQMKLSGTGFLIVPEKAVYIPDEIPSEDKNSKGATWGIDITGALDSPYTGAGVKVAVLDTGFHISHPDFEGREITSTSFVSDETVDDLHGHGTHCIGTACGSVNGQGKRYGVASGAHIYAGKVLNNLGSGAQSWILNGMTWAANQGCKVLSLSLGSPVTEGESYDLAYERAAQFALSKGTLVVAAAGNESRRSNNRFSPVASPADCPSILAVAAIDPELQVADFSNRAINPSGLVDIAAPGVDIYSSWPMPSRYHTLSGTSMATPHVAGIAALFFEKYPDATPAMIEEELRKNARSLSLPAEDVGAGLSIAPE